MSLLAVPILCAIYLPFINFGFAITMLAFLVIVSDGYHAPAMAVMQAVVKPQYKGAITGVYICVLNITGIAI